MGRNVKIREDYLQDATKLNRLAQAIRRDSKLPLQWREETSGLLMEASSRLVNPPKKEAEAFENQKPSKKKEA